MLALRGASKSSNSQVLKRATRKNIWKQIPLEGGSEEKKVDGDSMDESEGKEVVACGDVIVQLGSGAKRQ